MVSLSHISRQASLSYYSRRGAIAAIGATLSQTSFVQRAQVRKRYSEQADRGTSGSGNKSESAPLVDFGFTKVAENEKAKLVGQVFHNVADKYDLMNDLMSAGVHRVWKDHFVSKLSPTPGTRILDVAGGTGDIAFRMVDYMDSQVARGWGSALCEPSVVVCDINTSMLEVGRKRAEDRRIPEGLISWTAGDAEKLPFPDNTFDAYTIAFGIRNVTHVDVAIREAHRVLKPGGRFMCLEFSRVHSPIVSSVYDAFSFEVIPVIGQLVANDSHSYKYLVESIRKFPEQEVFADMIRHAGFSEVTYEDLTFGVAAIHSGFKL